MEKERKEKEAQAAQAQVLADRDKLREMEKRKREEVKNTHILILFHLILYPQMTSTINMTLQSELMESFEADFA